MWLGILSFSLLLSLIDSSDGPDLISFCCKYSLRYNKEVAMFTHHHLDSPINSFNIDRVSKLPFQGISFLTFVPSHRLWRLTLKKGGVRD